MRLKIIFIFLILFIMIQPAPAPLSLVKKTLIKALTVKGAKKTVKKSVGRIAKIKNFARENGTQKYKKASKAFKANQKISRQAIKAGNWKKLARAQQLIGKKAAQKAALKEGASKADEGATFTKQVSKKQSDPSEAAAAMYHRGRRPQHLFRKRLVLTKKLRI